jgi:hypothetical protein
MGGWTFNPLVSGTYNAAQSTNFESVKHEIDMVCCPFLDILPRRESI